MTHYGFRLYEVTLRRGARRDEVPFEQAGITAEAPRHFREVLLEHLAQLEGRRLVGEPKVLTPDGSGVELDLDQPVQDALLGQTAFRFVAHRESEGLIVGVLRRGRYGPQDVAMGDDQAPDVPLKGLAPSSWFRFILNLPDAGNVALLAVEEINRTAPVDLMLKWIGQHSRATAEAVPALGTGQPATPWWRLIGRQVTDPDNLERILRTGAFGEVKLTKRMVTGGRQVREKSYTVTAPSIREGAWDQLRGFVLGWRRAEGSDAPATTDAEAAQQLASLISPELEGIQFDDGQIAVPGSGGRPLKPSRLSELFTYDQTPADRRSSGVAFYRAVRANIARLGPLSAADDAGLHWPEDVNMDFPEVTG